MNHLEIEYKTLLSKAEYLRLLDEFSDVEPVFQTNHYIDSPDFSLKKARFSLRIRTLAHAAELTLKCPQAVGNMEYNHSLTLKEAEDLLEHFQLEKGPIYDQLVAHDIPISKLAIWGHLATKRYEKETPIGLMALDENHYNHHCDYELEVEVQEAQSGKRAFDRYLRQKAITFKYASSKVARTAASLKSAK